MRERKIVVAGLITRSVGDGAREVLLTKRRADQPLPNQWEFPGGKVEAGEHPCAALARELEEEIGVNAVVGAIWDVVFHAYPDFDVLMLIYKCRLPAGASPRPVEVAALAWTAPAGLSEYDILAADAPLVGRLIAQGIPAWEPASLGAGV